MRWADTPPLLLRYDRYGPMREMSRIDGYVMARRKGRQPFVVTVGEWNSLSRVPIDGEKIVCLRIVRDG